MKNLKKLNKNKLKEISGGISYPYRENVFMYAVMVFNTGNYAGLNLFVLTENNPLFIKIISILKQDPFFLRAGFYDQS